VARLRLFAVAMALIISGCSSGTAAPVDPGCAGSLHAPGGGTPHRRAAAATAAAYLRAAASHRSTAALAQPAGSTACTDLYTLSTWLGHIPIRHLAVSAVPIGEAGPHAVAVLATLRARLGHAPGTISVSLGQRVLAVAGGAHPLVTNDLSAARGTSQDGLAAIPDATYLVGRSGVVVSAGTPARDSLLARRVMDDVYPRLASSLDGTRLPAPLIVIVPQWQIAENVIGTQVPRYDAGIEYDGIVALLESQWCCGRVQREGIVVHELTHAAASGLVGGPRSMVEGVARYEEENWDAAHGAPLQLGSLATAYRNGWSSATSWQSGLDLWYDVSGDQLDLRYLDGAAIVRQVVADSGLAGLRRLARALDAYRSPYYPVGKLNRAFLRATGETFAQVAARARAATIRSAG
jgi:hypothetical protein